MYGTVVCRGDLCCIVFVVALHRNVGEHTREMERTYLLVAFLFDGPVQGYHTAVKNQKHQVYIRRFHTCQSNEPQSDVIQFITDSIQRSLPTFVSIFMVPQFLDFSDNEIIVIPLEITQIICDPFVITITLTQSYE